MSKHGLKIEHLEDGFLNCENSKIHYTKFGSGDKLLIALHGFGDQSASFVALESALKNDYTVYAIDLPFHNQTQWQKDSFSQKDMIRLFKLILDREDKKRFELMGYSYGGRIILAMLSKIVEDLDKIYLIAPDGIKTKMMVRASIVPVWLRRILKNYANNPEMLIKIIEGVYKMGFVSKFNFHFIKFNLRSPKLRDRIFDTWISLSNFDVDLKKAKELLKEYAIPVELYYGKHDKIIPLNSGERLSSGLPNARLHVLNEGHLLLNEKLSELIKNQLNEN